MEDKLHKGENVLPEGAKGFNSSGEPVFKKIDILSRWWLRDVKVYSKNLAVIEYHNPTGVNMPTKIHVRLNPFDLLAGRKIEQKTYEVAKKWQGIFDERNKELEYLDLMRSRIKIGIKP